MACAHCSHCKALGTVPEADPRLRFKVAPPRPGGGNGRGANASKPFYREFTRVYRLARKHYPTRPAVALMAANPGTTPEQVKWWRRQSVAQKLLDPGRGDTARPDLTAAAQQRKTVDVKTDAKAQAILGDSWLGSVVGSGYPITRDMLKYGIRRHPVDTVVATLVKAGWTAHEDDTFTPPA